MSDKCIMCGGEISADDFFYNHISITSVSSYSGASVNNSGNICSKCMELIERKSNGRITRAIDDRKVFEERAVGEYVLFSVSDFKLLSGKIISVNEDDRGHWDYTVSLDNDYGEGYTEGKEFNISPLDITTPENVVMTLLKNKARLVKNKEGENEIILCPECSKIKKLTHHKDCTVGLYATDKPELFKDHKDFDKMFKIEF